METEQKEHQVSPSVIRFGKYEVDLQRQELRRNGLMIHLQSQPFTLLTLLLERPNQVVTRIEMREALWGEDITVDFEQSLNSAIKKLRESLEDSAINPRFIETVARRGYRFIAPITSFHIDPFREDAPATAVTPARLSTVPASVSVPTDALPETSAAPAAAPSRSVSARENIGRRQSLSMRVFLQQHRILWRGLALYGALLLLSVLGWRILRNLATPAWRITQITSSSHVFTGVPYSDVVPSMMTDGPKIYFPMFREGKSLLSSALAGDGETDIIHLPPEINMPIPTDISLDATRLLVMDRLGLASEYPLWIVPVNGGGAERIANTLAHDAIWTPDGDHILFAYKNNIYKARNDGNEVTLFVSLSSRAFWLRWSPDGKRLRFTLTDVAGRHRSLWEIDAEGHHLHPVLPLAWKPGASVCCGSWTEDGAHFLFSVAENGHSDLWEQDEHMLGLLPWPSSPHRITNGPMDFLAPLAGRHDTSVYAIGQQQNSRQFSFDPSTHQVLPDLPLPTEVRRTEFSADSHWMAWLDDRTGSLWRSRSDGTQRLQLTTPPSEVWMMKWSPDAQRIAYVARMPGEPWRIHIISAAGDQSSVPLPEDHDQTDVDWSPDGHSLLFGRVPNSVKADSETKYLYLYDLSARRLSTVPSSLGITSPRYSPDGRYIAAIRNEGRQLVLYNTATQQWSLLQDRPISDPVWSHDGRSIFFLAFQPEGRTVYRLYLADNRLERVIGIEDIRLNDVGAFWFYSLAPGDIPLIRLNSSNANIYRIDKNP